MKVKYFAPEIFDLDNLMNVFPVMYDFILLVQAYMPVDRTGHSNPFHMSYNPIPKFKNFNKSWEECCMEAARDLWKLGKPIIANYFNSGGIDSSGVLIALVETKSEFRCVEYSIHPRILLMKFPLMWEKMVKDKNDPLPHKEMLDSSLFENHDIIKVMENMVISVLVAMKFCPCKLR